jgi:hypothetical protein
MTTTAVKNKHPSVNGKPIEFRWEQQLGWGLIVAAVFAAMVAGAYATITQVDWNFFGIHLFWFKPGFDNGLWNNIKSASYPLYRHAERDIGEPAYATFGILTVMAKAKYWGRRVATWRLFVTPPLVIVLAGGLIIGATWLIYFGLPQAFPQHWAKVNIWDNAHYPVVATLAFGFVIGRICHLLWAPVGAHIQGDLLSGSVYRHLHPSEFGFTVKGGPPAWVRLPLSPPVVREHWWYLYTKGTVRKVKRSRAWLYGTLGVVGFLLFAIGILFHFVIGVAGIHVPYFSPPPIPGG